MSNLDKLSHWQLGERVSGTYCGQAFTGELNAYTRPTADYRNVIFCVSLDTPINVYGQERKSVEVWSNHKTNTIQSNNS